MAPPFPRVPQRAVDHVLDGITVPSFDRLLDGRALRGMRPVTAREKFRSAMHAVIETQQAGVAPTDATLHRHGAPPPDTLARFFRCCDLADLPGVQARAAFDADVVQPPGRFVVEAHTEATTGPDKIGTAHLLPPPGAPHHGRGGAPNTEGGIASAIVLADCDDTILPVGEIPLHQEWWHPDSYPVELREAAEAALRDRGDFPSGRFIAGPDDVAHELLERLAFVESLGWDVRIEGSVIAGGRMRTGFPAISLEYGAGRQNRYFGCNLEALRCIKHAGFVPFFELPTTVRRGTTDGWDRCDWSFRVTGELLTLPEVERLLHDPESAWREVDHELVEHVAEPGASALWLPTSASAPDVAPLDVQLVMLVGDRGQADLYVSALPAHLSDDRLCLRLVELAAAESGRRRPDSPVEASLRALLERGYLQRNRRRRNPERRGYAALLQTGLGVLALAGTIEA